MDNARVYVCANDKPMWSQLGKVPRMLLVRFNAYTWNFPTRASLFPR